MYYSKRLYLSARSGLQPVKMIYGEIRQNPASQTLVETDWSGFCSLMVFISFLEAGP